jgi:hypothetical protein
MWDLLVGVCWPGFDLPKYTRERNPAYNRRRNRTSYTSGGGEHVAKGRSMKKEKKKPKKEKK